MFWCQSGKTLGDGLREIKCAADILAMIAATIEHKNLLLIVDHGETVNRVMRDDIMLNDKNIQDEERSVPNDRRGRRLFGEGSSSGCGDEEIEEEGGVDAATADSETDEDFYDSDFDIEMGTMICSRQT